MAKYWLNHVKSTKLTTLLIQNLEKQIKSCTPGEHPAKDQTRLCWDVCLAIFWMVGCDRCDPACHIAAHSMHGVVLVHGCDPALPQVVDDFNVAGAPCNPLTGV